MLCLNYKAILYYIKTFAINAQYPEFLDCQVKNPSFTSFTLFHQECTTLLNLSTESLRQLLDCQDSTSKYWFHDF